MSLESGEKCQELEEHEKLISIGLLNRKKIIGGSVVDEQR
jgi:hypothetical protein